MGVVIFALITIVQYLVVARGAERVAQVAARFASTVSQADNWPSTPMSAGVSSTRRRPALAASN